MKFRSILSVLWLVLVAAGLNASASGVAAAQATGATRYEGVLNVIWGDPRPGTQGGGTQFSLVTGDGAVRPLEIAPEDQNAAIASFGKRVVVFGRTLQGASESAASPIAVDRLEASASSETQQRIQTRRILYILLKFSGDAQEPHPINFYKELTNPEKPPSGSVTPGTINGFFIKTSYGKLKWRADVAGVGGLKPTDWFTLPKTKAGYANCGFNDVCADLTGLANDGFNLAKNAGIDLSVYDNINFVINNDLDCCAWGGGTSFDGKFYGATWEPPWGQEARVYVHELGHSIGLPHSGWVYYAYDSPWDEMSTGSSAASVQCGTYNSANSGGAASNIFCDKPGGGYITAHKDFLGWIPAANQVVIKKKSKKTVTLTANATALGKSIKLIKICLKGEQCSGNSAHYLTVEARTDNANFDKGLPGEGVIIHDVQRDRGPIGGGNPCFFNSQSGWAVPIDRTSGDWSGPPNCNSGGQTYPDYALFNAQFPPGKTYKDSGLGVEVEVLSRNGTNYKVKVTRSK